MYKPILVVIVILLTAVGGVLAVMELTRVPTKYRPQGMPTPSVQHTEQTKPNGVCTPENVPLPNYGDPGKRLKNCFVQYPGEPSRQDKSYYIVEDICGQFTRDFMANTLGGTIVKTEPPTVAGQHTCTYYLTDKEYVMVNLEYLAIANQQKGNEAMGRRVEKDAKIPMDNLVVYQEDGAINVIYLVLGPQKFLSLRPSSKKTIPNNTFLAWAANIGDAIKGYK